MIPGYWSPRDGEADDFDPYAGTRPTRTFSAGTIALFGLSAIIVVIGFTFAAAGLGAIGAQREAFIATAAATLAGGVGAILLVASGLLFVIGLFKRGRG